MRRTLLFFLILFLINCDNSLKKEVNLIDFVPTNPLFLLKFQSIKKTNTEKFNKNFNLLINYKTDSISRRFSGYPLLISYHKIGKNKLQSIIFSKKQNSVFSKKVLDSIEYNGFIIKRRQVNNIDHFSSEKNGVYFESISKLLIENTLRNSNHMSVEKSTDLKRLYDISNSNMTIFISENFSQYFKNTNLNKIFNISQITDWMQFDIELNNNSMVLNGLGIIRDSIFKKINILKNTNPSISNINKVVPINFKYYERSAYEHDKYIRIVKNEKTIDELKKVSNDSLLYEVNEIGSILIGTEPILCYSFKKNPLLYDKILKNLNFENEYRNFKIYKFPKNLFNINKHLNKYSPLKLNYVTIIGNIMVLSENKKSLENIILNFNNKSTLEKSAKFAEANNNIPEKSNQLRVYNLEYFESKLFDEIKIKKEDYNFWISHFLIDKNFIYKTHSITKIKEQTEEPGPKILFNTKINNDIYLEPKWVKNYVTKEKELVLQDNKNIFYLLSNKGEIIWEKDLRSKIIGDVFQIDLYKNGRLQYVFNTESSFIILDKNGKEVKKIDHKSNVKVLGLSVFDYDKNKNYRFLICYDKSIKMLNSKMKIVKGFNKKTIKHKITNSPKHFRIGSKDFLVTNTDKKLYITDRRGNIRIKTTENLKVSGNEIFLNDNSFLIVDDDNNLIKIDLEGKISKKPLPLESKYLISANQNNKVYFSENTFTINNKNVIMKYGNYSEPKIFGDDFFQITNFDENKIYLFKSDGVTVSSFPLFGSSKADFTIDKDNKKMIAVIGEKNEILVYYFD